MDTSRQRLSRRRAADGITPGWDSDTEARMDECSPLRNPQLAQQAFARAKALREGSGPDGSHDA